MTADFETYKPRLPFCAGGSGAWFNADRVKLLFLQTDIVGTCT